MSAIVEQDPLFDPATGQSIPESAGSATQVSRSVRAARRLAVDFTDDAELPERLKKSGDNARPRKANKKDSELEKRYRANVRSWTRLIETMLAKMDSQAAWRFVEISPQVEPTARRASECKDFCDFLDYLILRRDVEECDGEELGLLAMLLSAFQRKIEKAVAG